MTSKEVAKPLSSLRPLAGNPSGVGLDFLTFPGQIRQRCEGEKPKN